MRLYKSHIGRLLKIKGNSTSIVSLVKRMIATMRIHIHTKGLIESISMMFLRLRLTGLKELEMTTRMRNMMEKTLMMIAVGQKTRMRTALAAQSILLLILIIQRGKFMFLIEWLDRAGAKG